MLQVNTAEEIMLRIRKHLAVRFCHILLLGIAWVGLCAERSHAIRISGELNEFNGYVMEAPLGRYPSLTLIKTWSTDFVEEVGLYENPREMPTIDGVSFLTARYRFANAQLESIQLTYRARENRERLLKWIEERYGKLLPAERKMINQVEWHGDRLTIALSYDSNTGQGNLWFISPTLHHLVNKNINDMTE
jgi:hypothetical protein